MLDRRTKFFSRDHRGEHCCALLIQKFTVLCIILRLVISFCLLARLLGLNLSVVCFLVFIVIAYALSTGCCLQGLLPLEKTLFKGCAPFAVLFVPYTAVVPNPFHNCGLRNTSLFLADFQVATANCPVSENAI